MQNLEVHITVSDVPNVAMEAVRALLETISNIQTEKESIQILVRCPYFSDQTSETYSYLDHVTAPIARMMNFSCVSVLVYFGGLHVLYTPAGMMSNGREFKVPGLCKPEFRRLSEELGQALGPCRMQYHIGGFNRLTYHPRDHVKSTLGQPAR